MNSIKAWSDYKFTSLGSIIICWTCFSYIERTISMSKWGFGTLNCLNFLIAGALRIGLFSYPYKVVALTKTLGTVVEDSLFCCCKALDELYPRELLKEPFQELLLVGPSSVPGNSFSIDSFEESYFWDSREASCFFDVFLVSLAFLSDSKPTTALSNEI